MKKTNENRIKRIAWILVAALAVQSTLPGCTLSASAEPAAQSGGVQSPDEIAAAGEAEDGEGIAVIEVEAAGQDSVPAEDEDGQEEEILLDPETAFSEDNLCHGRAYLGGTGIELTASQLALWQKLEAVGDGLLQGSYINGAGNGFEVPAIVSGGLDNGEFDEAMTLFHFAHPEYFFYDGYTYRQQHNGYAVTMKIRSDYRTPEAFRAKWTSIKNAANSYLYGAAPLMTDYEKAQYLYERLTKGSVYAYDSDGKPDSTPASHNIDGILTRGKGVCEGFALTYSMLLNCCGIPNVIAVGQGFKAGGTEIENMDHAWNIVQMGEDEKTYLCDATWDEAATDKAQWNYFMIGSNTDGGMAHRHLAVCDQDESRDTYQALKEHFVYDYSKTDYVAPTAPGDSLCKMTLQKPERRIF